MAQTTIQSIRGMEDILPQDTPLWLHFEAIAREWLFAFGYQQIRTPIVEATPLFVRGVGEHTDIVEKEMYSFEDCLNGEKLTLRPEGTAGCVRACIEHGLLYNQTQRLWYIGPMFRHERPQKGRYRQFHQLGVEAFGFETPDVDAEVILMLADLWERLGLHDLKLQINSLGEALERATHRQELIAYLEQHQTVLDEDARRRLYTNPLRILDTKNPALQHLIHNAPKLIDFLGEASRQHFSQVCALLETVGIEYTINHGLVRGLDYYNRTVFEWTTRQLGAQSTVAAGGRYDSLVEQLGGKPCPGIGFAIGIERILLLLETQDPMLPSGQLSIYLVHEGEAAGKIAFRLADQLRKAGFRALLHCGGGHFKSQFKKANASGAEFAVIIGPNEIEHDQVQIKHLRNKHVEKQIAIPSMGLVSYFRNLSQKQL